MKLSYKPGKFQQEYKGNKTLAKDILFTRNRELVSSHYPPNIPKIKIWDRETGTLTRTKEFQESRGFSLIYHNQRNQLFISFSEGNIVQWDLNNGPTEQKLSKGQLNSPRIIAFRQNEEKVIIEGRRGNISTMIYLSTDFRTSYQDINYQENSVLGN